MTKRTITLKIDTAHGYPKVDTLNRPHCEDGPSLRVCPEDMLNTDFTDEQLKEAFSFLKPDDNYQVYFWHGINIPDNIAETLIEHPENLTVEFIDSITNLEIRRVAIERFGFSRYVQEGQSKILHEEWVTRVKGPNGGKQKIKQYLIQADNKEDEPITGVFAPNSSPNGRFEKEVIEWKPLSEFAPHDQARILRKYENTGSIKTINNVLSVRQVIESGKFIPDLDDKGNYIYKMYFMPCHPELRPFWFKLGDDGKPLLDREGDPVQEFGAPQEPTCQNALASTFGLTGEEYAPDVES